MNLDEGRFKPYDFDTFKGPTSSILNYKIEDKYCKLKLYYRKHDDKVYFVSMYDDNGGFHSDYIHKSKLDRLKIFASKEYYLHKRTNVDESIEFDFYLEWVYCDYFTTLVSDLTLYFVSYYFDDFEFIDIKILSELAEINVSTYIMNITEKYKKSIIAVFDKHNDDLTKYKSVIGRIMSTETKIPLFWHQFKKIMSCQNIVLKSEKAYRNLLEYAIDVKVTRLKEIEQRVSLYKEMSPTIAFGPNSAVYRKAKKDFEGSFL